MKAHRRAKRHENAAAVSDTATPKTRLKDALRAFLAPPAAMPGMLLRKPRVFRPYLMIAKENAPVLTQRGPSPQLKPRSQRRHDVGASWLDVGMSWRDAEHFRRLAQRVSPLLLDFTTPFELV
jgi:hypothetical protein